MTHNTNNQGNQVWCCMCIMNLHSMYSSRLCLRITRADGVVCKTEWRLAAIPTCVGLKVTLFVWKKQIWTVVGAFISWQPEPLCFAILHLSSSLRLSDSYSLQVEELPQLLRKGWNEKKLPATKIQTETTNASSDFHIYFGWVTWFAHHR